MAFQAGPAAVVLIEASAEEEALLAGVWLSSSSGSMAGEVSPSNPGSVPVARDGVECAGTFTSTGVSDTVVGHSLLVVDSLAEGGPLSSEVV